MKKNFNLENLDFSRECNTGQKLNVSNISEIKELWTFEM